MKPGDQCHKWVEWSAADEAYIGKCPMQDPDEIA